MPTPDYAATALPRKTPETFQILDSPDEKWQARIVVRACLDPLVAYDVGADVLLIRNNETGQESIADEQALYCDGAGAGGLKALFWSENSRYLYYTRARTGVPDGCGYWSPPYSVYDTVMAETQLLGSGKLSPDKTLLAVWGADELVIWNLNGGEVAQSLLDDPTLVPGPIAWSRDDHSLVYMQTSGYCPPGDTFLTRLDAPDYKTVFKRKLAYPDFGGIDWKLADELRLMDWRNMQWRYVMSTDYLEPISFTPAPTSANLEQFVSDTYSFTFQYPADWDEKCCRIGGTAPTAKHLVTLAEPKTVTANTDAPFNGFAVFVEENPAKLKFRDYVESEKKRMTHLRQESAPLTSGPGIERGYVVGGREGVLLRGYLEFNQSFIYIPLSENRILIVVANLQQQVRWDHMLGNIFATFRFE